MMQLSHVAIAYLTEEPKLEYFVLKRCLFWESSRSTTRRSVTRWRAVPADAASSEETDCYDLVTLGGEGHSSVGSAVGT